MAEIESIPTMSAVEHAAEVFKRTNQSDTVGQWERADAIRDAVAEEMPDSNRAMARLGQGGEPDGLYIAIERVSAKLGKADIPEDLAITTVAKYRNVSLAWPGEERFDPSKASYAAHADLAAKQWDGKRHKALERLLSRSSRGYVTRADVRRWKSDQEKPTPKPWEERFEKKLDWMFHRWVERPQAPGEYQTAVRLLTAMLNEMREKAAA